MTRAGRARRRSSRCAEALVPPGLCEHPKMLLAKEGDQLPCHLEPGLITQASPAEV